MVNTLIETSEGDLRRSITYLQSASRLSSSAATPSKITPRDIQEIAGVVPSQVINTFASVLGIEVSSTDEAMDVDDDSAPKPIRATNFDDVKKQIKLLMRLGYSASQILSQVGAKSPTATAPLIFMIFSCMT